MSRATLMQARPLRWLALVPVAFVLAWFSQAAGLNALLALVAAFGAAALWLHIGRDLQIGMLVLLFLSYSRLSDALVLVGLPSLMKLFVAGLGLILLVRLLFYNERLTGWRVPLWIYGAYCLLVLASIFRAAEPTTITAGINQLFTNGIVFMIAAVLIARERDLSRPIWALLIAGLLIGGASVFQFATGTYENSYFGLATPEIRNIVGDINDYRMVATGLGSNEFAQIMVILVPLALNRLVSEKSWPARVIALLTLAIILAVVLLTYSRSILIILVAVVGLILLVSRFPSRYLLMLGAVACLAVYALPEPYFERLSALIEVVTRAQFSEISDPALLGRLSENIIAAQIFRDHPLLGVGEGNYEVHYQDYSRNLALDQRRTPRPAHNLYLEIAAEHGVIGLIAFAALEITIFFGLRRAYLQTKSAETQAMILAFGLAWIALLMSHFFLHMITPRNFWILHAIGLAIPRMGVRSSGGQAS